MEADEPPVFRGEGNCVVISKPGEVFDEADPGFDDAVMTAKTQMNFPDGLDEGIEILEMSDSLETTPNGINFSCTHTPELIMSVDELTSKKILIDTSLTPNDSPNDSSSTPNSLTREFSLTPDATTSSASLCDSGFADSIDEIKLKCFECVLEWPSEKKGQSKKNGSEGEHTACTCNMQEHSEGEHTGCTCNMQEHSEGEHTGCTCNMQEHSEGEHTGCTCNMQEHSEGEHTACTCNMQEHSGFEEYVDDIFIHRLSIEDKYFVPDCLANQPKITPNVRRSLIQWLTTVHHEFKLCQDTLYLAVNIIDRMFNVMQVSRDCLELLGITCLLIGCKQNEVTPPEINELLEQCGDPFTHQQVRQLEIIVLLATSFDLLAPTVQQFLEYFASFCLNACAGDSEQEQRFKMARAVGRCVLELSLPEYEFCQFKPSLLALCVWKASVEYLKTDDGNYYPPGMDYSYEEYDLCMTRVGLFIGNIQKSNLDMSSMCKKYTSLYNYQ